jgi:tRNA A-37 threonylcarbamoyl transferase component Bud32
MTTNAATNQCPKCGAPVPNDAPQALCPKCVLAEAATSDPQAAATATGEIPTIERIATAFPQLEIIELIGRGGMGFVFKARQPRLDRFVALKLLPDKLARDPHFAERFNREGRFLARLNHPNIVSVFDFGQTGGFYFLTMEFVDGVNLRQAMQAGKFSPTEALSIVPNICEALHYAHEQGVLHRDIKPENILLDAKGRVKIADFGIAKLVGEDKPSFTLTGTGTALGTPHYMAPEQLEKSVDIDHRADIYSLGVVFYEMLTGELPIGRFKAPSQRTPLDARIDEIVLRALERERDLRQKNAREFKTQVEHITSNPPPPPLLAAPPSGPHGTTVIPDTRYSQQAIWSAAIVALSIAFPILVAASLQDAGIALWLGLPLLAGIAGTILGWVALSDIRAGQGRVRGLPLAVFGALTWPLLMLLGIAAGIPYFLVRVNAARGAGTILATLAPFLVLAGVITFAIWAVYSATRWGSGRYESQRRGVLKWIFAALLIAAVAAIFIIPRNRAKFGPTHVSPAAASLENPTISDTTLWIRFTFTGVEVRDEADKRWLAFDYVEHIHGKCQHAFRNQTKVPGFTGQIVTSSFLAREDDSPEVLHHRVSFLLPSSVTHDEARQFRDALSGMVAKSIKVYADQETSLFEFPVGDGGIVAASIGVKPVFQ